MGPGGAVPDRKLLRPKAQFCAFTLLRRPEGHLPWQRAAVGWSGPASEGGTPMLRMTPEATKLLDAAKRAEEVPDSFGVRVYGIPTEDGQVELCITFAEKPQEGDSVSEQQGSRLFVARGLAAVLSGSLI